MERLANEIDLIRRRSKEAENNNLKKINNYKGLVTQLTNKLESLENGSNKYNELLKKDTKNKIQISHLKREK